MINFRLCNWIHQLFNIVASLGTVAIDAEMRVIEVWVDVNVKQNFLSDLRQNLNREIRIHNLYLLYVLVFCIYYTASIELVVLAIVHNRNLLSTELVVRQTEENL